MVGRLAAHPANVFAYYEDGAVTRKAFPAVLEDVLAARRKLASWGLEPGMRAGIFATNSYAWIVHDLALILLGVTTVPFPDETLVEEIPALFDRFQVNLLLASGDRLPAYTGRQPIALLDQDAASAPRLRRYAQPAGRQEAGPQPPSIVFSSGSSGKLKALKTSDAGTMRVLEHFCGRYQFYADDELLVFLPLHSYQQRLMVYGCIDHGVNLALVRTDQAFKGLKDFAPTLCLAPPILFETVHKQFEDGLRAQPRHRRLAFAQLLRLAALAPPPLRRRILGRCYRPLRSSFGGRIRLMWTGMAPIKRSTLELFAAAQLPLVETYGLTESGPIACNTPRENRLGSIGKPIVPGSVRLAADGEIIVERDAFLTTGYEGSDRDEELSTYVAPGRIATGDIGYFDADGFLYIKGRKKEAIITAEGNKIHPELVEGRLNRSPLVLQSVVLGNGLPHLAAVMVVRRPEAERREAERWLAEVNGRLPHGITVARLVLTAEEFTKANRLLTENLKLNRRAIFRRYYEKLI